MRHKLFTLVHEDDPILRLVQPEFDFSDPPCSPQLLAGRMLATMSAEGGIGLAAPQVGLPYRMFVMTGHEDGEERACFNPVVLSASETLVKGEEGCLSFPGLWLKVARSQTIVVQYQNDYGKLVNETFADRDARCYLHETDHLNGVRFTSRVSRLAISMAKGRRAK